MQFKHILVNWTTLSTDVIFNHHSLSDTVFMVPCTTYQDHVLKIDTFGVLHITSQHTNIPCVHV